MAFSKEHRRIAELKNIERHHGFMMWMERQFRNVQNLS